MSNKRFEWTDRWKDNGKIGTLPDSVFLEIEQEGEWTHHELTPDTARRVAQALIEAAEAAEEAEEAEEAEGTRAMLPGAVDYIPTDGAV